jgi:hypothetical protein
MGTDLIPNDLVIASWASASAYPYRHVVVTNVPHAEATKDVRTCKTRTLVFFLANSSTTSFICLQGSAHGAQRSISDAS